MSTSLEDKQKQALVALSQGNIVDGISSLRECVDLCESEKGPNSLDTAQAVFSLALCLARDPECDPDSVIAHGKRALSIRQTVYGRVHASVALTAEFLANFFLSKSRNSEAEEMFRLALENAEQLVGAHHVNTAKLQLQLSDILVKSGRAEEALSLAEKGVETRKRFFPHNSPEYHSAVYCLAAALIANNDPGRAESVVSTLQEGSTETKDDGVFAPNQQAMR